MGRSLIPLPDDPGDGIDQRPKGGDALALGKTLQARPANLVRRYWVGHEMAATGETDKVHDVCVIGAGPAGLSAALILGRCRRTVQVLDSGKPRNAASRALHGFITQDGTHPMRLRALARAELAHYPTVTLQNVAATGVRRSHTGFETETADGRVVKSRILLLATGRDDELPGRPGFAELFGKGVYHCPICDGWEHRDQRLVVYGREEPAFDVAIALLTWSRSVTWCTDGPGSVPDQHRARLAANGIGIHEGEIERLVAGDNGQLAGIRFSDGQELPCEALFFVSDTPQKSDLPGALGCRFGTSGGVLCDDHAATDVPGLFVAGNVRCGVHLAITAAAEGAEAGIAINEALSLADAK